LGEDDRNTAVLTTACVVLGLILGVLLGGALAPPVINEPWLKTYQGLVGAVLGIVSAIAGLSVATYNVLRQMRINLMIREEDRIERDAVSIRTASAFLRFFETALTVLRRRDEGPDQLLEQLKIKFNQADDAIEVMEKAFPEVDVSTRDTLIKPIYLANTAAYFYVLDKRDFDHKVMLGQVERTEEARYEVMKSYFECIDGGNQRNHGSQRRN